MSSVKHLWNVLHYVSVIINHVLGSQDIDQFHLEEQEEDTFDGLMVKHRCVVSDGCKLEQHEI